MDKKILSIFLILVIVVSTTVIYVALKEPISYEDPQDYSLGEYPTDDDISNELDDVFISENDEIDIGDML